MSAKMNIACSPVLILWLLRGVVDQDRQCCAMQGSLVWVALFPGEPNAKPANRICRNTKIFGSSVSRFCCASLEKKKEKALGKSIDPGVERFSSNCCVSLEAQDASEYSINANPSPATCSQSLRSNMLRNSISVSLHTSASDCVLFHI